MAAMADRVQESLRQVIDPETGKDVISMRLVRDLNVEKDGYVELTFRPSSIFCPLGFQLGINIKEAVKGVPGVRAVRVKVENYTHAGQLEEMLAALD